MCLIQILIWQSACISILAQSSYPSVITISRAVSFRTLIFGSYNGVQWQLKNMNTSAFNHSVVLNFPNVFNAKSMLLSYGHGEECCERHGQIEE